jgi:hypothetical protein
VLLDIYVTSECENCQEALRIADLARGIPGIAVSVVSLDERLQAVPANVFAVPTYLLDGQIVSLGNPARDEFLAALRRQAQERAS